MVRLLGYLIAFALLVWAALIIAGYVLVVAVVGGVWALVEHRACTAGRPYIHPRQRFQMVWTRAVSPVDPRRWVTAEQQPAMDPRLLPGKVSGRLRIEDLGTERTDEPGPLKRFMVRARLHNHGPTTLRLDDLEHVDLQLWTPLGKVVGTHTAWSLTLLAPGYSCDVNVSVAVVDGQPIESWAISHRPNGEYVFFAVRGHWHVLSHLPWCGTIALCGCFDPVTVQYRQKRERAQFSQPGNGG